MDVITEYLVKGNSDTTEGMGHSITVAASDNITDAYIQATSGRFGVMGSKNSCNINMRKVIIYEGETFYTNEVCVYRGYQRDWPMGNLLAKVNPEYELYIRLKEKFDA